jgi:hypothetical protein
MHEEADEIFVVAMYELLRAKGAFPAGEAASDPIELWNRMKAEKSPARMRRATKEAIADILEVTQDIDGEALASVDGYLVKRGAPSLTAKRLGRTHWVARVMKRGSLLSDEEHRALVDSLNDTTDRRWTAALRKRANEMVAAYERRTSE